MVPLHSNYSHYKILPVGRKFKILIIPKVMSRSENTGCIHQRKLFLTYKDVCKNPITPKGSNSQSFGNEKLLKAVVSLYAST